MFQITQAADYTSRDNDVRYKIGVCDWMILKRQKLGAFQRTKEIGADGVEVDMGSLGSRDTFENSLADPAIRTQFMETADELGLSICSLAMSGFYVQSFTERPTALRMVEDCVKTMQQMKVKIAFLPLSNERICQIHCTDEDGVLLENNMRLDMPEVKTVLVEMRWHGWLVLERSRKVQDPSNVVRNFGANAAYLKSIFQNS